MIGKTLVSSSFEMTLRYVYGKEGAKVVDGTLAAAFSPDPLPIAKAMSAVARERSDTPCYHICLSPAQGDYLASRSWHKLSRDFLAGIGASTHQSVTVLHTDATYPDGETRPHLHFVINRYDRADASARALCLAFSKIERVIRQLEQDYSLESIPCSWEVDRHGDAPRQYHRTQREQLPSARSHLQNAIDQAAADQPTLPTLVTRLKAQAIEVRFSEFPNGRKGLSFADEGSKFKGSSLGRAYSLKGLQEQQHVSYQAERDDTLLHQLNAMSAQECRSLLQSQAKQPISSPVPTLPEPSAPAIDLESSTSPTTSEPSTEPSAPTPNPTAAIDPTLHPAAMRLLKLVLDRLEEIKHDRSEDKYLKTIDNRYSIDWQAKTDQLTITRKSGEIMLQIISPNAKPEIAIDSITPQDERKFDQAITERKHQLQQTKPKQKAKQRQLQQNEL